MSSILWCEPILEVQILEALGLSCFVVAPIFALVRNNLKEWLKSGDSYLVEGIKRDAPPGFKLESLATTAAYEFSASSLAIGGAHFLAVLLCLPEVFREVQLKYAAAMIRHAALMGFAIGVVHIVDAFRQCFLVDESQRISFRTLVAVVGLHLSCLIISIPMNLHYSADYAYVLLIFGFHLAGFSANLLSVICWSLDENYLPNLPWLWLFGGLDAVITSLVRGLLFVWSLFMLKSSWIVDGALLLFLTGSVGTLFTLPASTSLLCASWARSSLLLKKAQPKVD
mmetsp:Transcript_64460/g.119920  ORF Transcript_64460/g.119920 Transcript_64460/m.119920 type:complete len:283 (+) Transcript_64460:61-909(+)